jgi:fucose permease
LNSTTKTYLASLAFAAVGMCSTAFSAALTPLAAEFGVPLATTGILISIQYLCFIGCALLLSTLIRRVGLRAIIVIGCVTLAAGLAVFGLAPSWPLALLAAFPLGIGFGLCGTLTNVYVAELNPARRGWALGLANFAFGCGALCSPFVAAALLAGAGSWRWLFAFDAGLALIALTLFVLILHSDRRERQPALPPHEATRTPATWHEPTTLLLALAMALYMALQTGLTAWTTPYLAQALGAAPALATLSGTTLWIGLTAGRFGSSFIGERYGYLRTLAASAALGTALLGGLLLVPFVPLALAGAALVGLAYGPCFPMVLAVAGQQVRVRGSAATGTVLAFGGMGASLGPWLAGHAGERYQMLSMLTLLSYSVAMCGLLGAFTLVRVMRRRRSNQVSI